MKKELINNVITLVESKATDIHDFGNKTLGIATSANGLNEELQAAALEVQKHYIEMHKAFVDYYAKLVNASSDELNK